MTPEPLDTLLEHELARRRDALQLRSRQVIDSVAPVHVEVGGKVYVNFASNNYLGLTHHPQIIAAGERALREHGFGGGASPLVSGYSRAHADAESAIAQWKATEAAVLLPSGYQTSHAVIQTLAAIAGFGPGVRLLIDKLTHASLIDAVIGSGVAFRIFPHNHLGKLRRLLDEALPSQLQVVVTESIFSMDGDAADLRGLAELKERRRFVLVLDEAHASGVYGAGGAGYASECGLQSAVDVSIVTFSKAAGIGGGAACGSRVFCDALVNWGRAYIYSTSVPPALASGISAAIGVMRAEPQRQQRVRALAQRVRSALQDASFLVPAGDSPIIPVVLGLEASAMDAAQRLREQGLLCVAIRPPTVPRGSSRLRVTLSCDHSDEDVDRLVDAVRSLPR